ncbi:MAG: SDR family oxidoreductase [bacterium]|nr:short chain dehydrogenase [Deltaproteobacteria bacterium]MCP4906107.1 SDR family oxidoreductase [bacterium]
MSSGKTQFDFTDQTVVVTGGSRGIGRQICKAFAEAGARVFTCSRRTPETPFDSDRIECASVDVRDPDATTSWLARCAEASGGIDVLVNNAGGAPSVASAEASPRLMNKILALNLNAPLILSTQVHQHMVDREHGGSIVNIVSISSQRPTPTGAAYGAAKAGLMNATTSLAVEWGPKIRVNCVVAGLVVTELTGDHYGDDSTKDQIIEAIPARRFASTEEIAHGVLFLAARDSSYVSGAALEVYGGGEWPPTIPRPASD